MSKRGIGVTITLIGGKVNFKHCNAEIRSKVIKNIIDKLIPENKRSAAWLISFNEHIVKWSCFVETYICPMTCNEDETLYQLLIYRTKEIEPK